MPVGYARCSTDAQDLTAQRNALTALGVKPNRIYVDHGLTGTTRARPGLREALAACRSGDTLVVTKLDRLARSLTDARNIVEELTEAGVKLNIGGSLHDPTDPVGRLLFNVLGMIAEFEIGLDQDADEGGYEGRQSQRSAARQAAQAQTRAGGAPRRALASGQAHQRRARRAVLRRALHRLPHGPTCWRAEDGHSGPPSVSSHIFVDESKERDYLLVAAVILSDDLDATRTLMRGLVLHGQHRYI